jgi:hypothetical protein
MSRKAMEGIYLLMAYVVVKEKWFSWNDDWMFSGFLALGCGVGCALGRRENFGKGAA